MTSHDNPLQAEFNAALADLIKAIASLRKDLDSKKKSLNTAKRQLDDANKQIADLQHQVTQLKISTSVNNNAGGGNKGDTETRQPGPQPQLSALRIASKSLIRSLKPSQRLESGCLAFSPDNNLLAYVDGYGTIALWDVAKTGVRNMCSIWARSGAGQFRPTITDMVFEPAGQRLWYLTSNYYIGYWDLNTPSLNLPESRANGVNWGLAISKDGRTLAVAGEPLEIYLLPTFTSFRQIRERMLAIAFSPDGVLLACVVSSDIKILDPLTGEVHKSFYCGSTDVSSVQFSPDGKWLVSGGGDNIVRVWDWEAGKLQSSLYGHEKEVQCVTFLAQGKLVASASINETIRIWDWATLREIDRFDHYTGLSWKNQPSLVVSRDSSLLAFAAWELDSYGSKMPTTQLWRLNIN